ncbi:MAG: DUF1501 domain-containing protein [Blastocatellia bacterium]
MNTTRRGLIRQIVIGNQTETQTLVCVFLRGGADTLNLIVPYGDDRYYKLRPTIAIPAPAGNAEATDAAIRLDDYYAFHPKLRSLLPLYREGRLGIVQSVGSDNASGSHFEAQDQMEHGEALGQSVGASGGGWLGRYLRSRTGGELTPLSAVAIGPTIPEALRGAPRVSALQSLDEVRIKSPSSDPRAVIEALATMYGAEAGVLSQPGRMTLDLLNRVEALQNNAYRPEGAAVYPDDDFGRGLREVVRLIKANVGLEAACVDLGGWDTHFFQGTTDGLQAAQIELLARGLAAFDADLQRHRDQVTVLAMTEFGRRVYENGSLGTDHGRGFAMMAIGNRINGGKVHGRKPELNVEDDSLFGPGGLLIHCDYRSVLAEILTGVLGARNLHQVFPRFQPSPVGLVSAVSSYSGFQLDVTSCQQPDREAVITRIFARKAHVLRRVATA